MSEGMDFLTQIEHDAEPLPTIVGGGREAIDVPLVLRDKIKASYDLLNAGKGAEAVQRILVPVKASEMSWRDQTSKRKDKNGNLTETVTKWQQHPMVTRTITVIRRAAELEGLGARIVVDRQDTEDGSKGFKVSKGTVRVRFVGMKRKERKPKDATQTTNTAAQPAA